MFKYGKLRNKLHYLAYERTQKKFQRSSKFRTFYFIPAFCGHVKNILKWPSKPDRDSEIQQAVLFRCLHFSAMRKKHFLNGHRRTVGFPKFTKPFYFDTCIFQRCEKHFYRRHRCTHACAKFSKPFKFETCIFQLSGKM